jgi:flagellar hook-basal body complex protein FliE
MSPLPPIGSMAVVPTKTLFPTDEVGSAQPASTNASGTFGNMVSEGLAHINEQLQSSQADLQKLAMGDAQNIHQVMIRLEESRLSFQLMLQVRGRLLEAYQDVMKMQI